MTRLSIIVDQTIDWKAYHPTEDLRSAQAYLDGADLEPQRVINLCRSYKYMSRGYYVSLLAEARGHKVIPSVKALTDLSQPAIYGVFDQSINKALDKVADTASKLSWRIYFGETQQSDLADVSRQLFERFSVPILEVRFHKKTDWQLASVRAVGLNKLGEDEEVFFAESLERFSKKIWRAPRAKRNYRYDLAILVNKDEALPPSDKAALRKFERAAKRQGLDVDFIQPSDYFRLAEYDALFIRETTNVNHHTYRFSRKAAYEGMVVMDDPDSILRCTNKIYLSDLIHNRRLPAPASRAISQINTTVLGELEADLGYPMVLKIPDGAFSRGVIKVNDADGLKQTAADLLSQSAIILAQAYVPTDYDWRIGVLGGRAIYACRYFMAKGHWQIYNHAAKPSQQSGGFETVPTHEAPRAVIKAALDVASAFGDGLYGVDLKQKGDDVYIIEVNDNPSIDSGVEDAWAGDGLYDAIMETFRQRLDRR
ncbi:RimK family protein [Saccharospirillum sp. HFRX-1]|uniref:RimK family protein n=1 Tax=unclassified Saccharospirillum TaxID=2633430 RepID=UPI00371CC178